MKSTCLVISACLGVAGMLFPAGAEAGTYSGGSGAPADPYTISTVADWQELTSASDDWNQHFLLTADLDFGGAILTPVGNGAPFFTGALDGAGHTLSNLKIDQPTSNVVGLFLSVYFRGQVTNLGVVNAEIHGHSWVGGLAGENLGTITSCYVTGTVIGSGDYVGGLVGMNDSGTITSCYASDAVSGNQNVGGLVGYNFKTITSCYASGTVSGNQNVGGLVGMNDSGTMVTSCYASGAVNGNQNVGGLVGFNFETITSCYATGAVSGQSSVGGLVGTDYSNAVSGCFWDTQTSGQITSSGGTGKTTAEMKTLSTFLAAGWDFTHTWIMPCDYPHLLWEITTYSGGSGTAGDPYRIECVADWQLLITRPGDWDKSFILTADLDFGGASLTPVGNGPAFTGVLDGASHTLSNLKIDQPSNNGVGLFGVVSGGQVKNLGVVNATIRGQYYVGGLVGENHGTITSCYATGAVTGTKWVGGLVGGNYGGSITSCYVTGTVIGSGSGNYVGGLVGINQGPITSSYSAVTVSGYTNVGGLAGYNWKSTITNCYATGAVSGFDFVGGLVGDNDSGRITSCYATGAITGTKWVGGLVGYNIGTITSCNASGSVSGNQNVGGLVGINFDTITSCYATGAVSGQSSVGGLVGNDYSNAVSGCFWDTQTTGQTTSAGGTGKTTAEMKTLATFTSAGWDFGNTWDIGENQTYPYLRKGPEGDLNHDGHVDLLDFALFAGQWMK